MVNTTTLNQFKTVHLDGYTVRYHDGDTGPFITGCTFDEFALFYKEDKVALLRVEHPNDENLTTTRFALTMLNEHIVPFVAGDLHLTAAIMDTVMHHFTPDHEFYVDIFSDEKPALPLMVAV